MIFLQAQWLSVDAIRENRTLYGRIDSGHVRHGESGQTEHALFGIE